ncbi:hypothetical protein QVD17_25827 [Tagetes erecta]|uniref:Uncharacterized protein n=1 Tax=Tagetes erecta TaxID=13708 RepID=A0AAD8K8Z4_TARER|nr:hypothetical protein QVD17_25827 [Tagetes erecta]
MLPTLRLLYHLGIFIVVYTKHSIKLSLLSSRGAQNGLKSSPGLGPNWVGLQSTPHKVVDQTQVRSGRVEPVEIANFMTAKRDNAAYEDMALARKRTKQRD